MSVSALTDAEKRQIRDYNPSLSDRPPGFDLAEKLDDIISDVNSAAVAGDLVSGVAVVLNTQTSIAVTLDAAHDGSTVMATLQEANGTVGVASAVWNGSGELTITLTGAATADRDVGYFYVVGQ